MITNKDTIFTDEGAKSFSDTYCKSCDTKSNPQGGCVGETAENCRAFRLGIEIIIQQEGAADEEFIYVGGVDDYTEEQQK